MSYGYGNVHTRTRNSSRSFGTEKIPNKKDTPSFCLVQNRKYFFSFGAEKILQFYMSAHSTVVCHFNFLITTWAIFGCITCLAKIFPYYHIIVSFYENERYKFLGVISDTTICSTLDTLLFWVWKT